MDNTGTTLFVSGIERISAIILHIGLSLLIYRAVKAGKCRTAAFTAVLAYGIHFIVDFFAVAGPALLPIYVIEIGVFVMAAGTLVMALKMGRMEEL
ncbi:MAG: YhfC family glutamic-type intramembrane protease [Ruminococcus sp.]